MASSAPRLHRHCLLPRISPVQIAAPIISVPVTTKTVHEPVARPSSPATPERPESPTRFSVRPPEEFQCADPLSGHLFVFRSRRGDRIKLLWWEKDGLAIFYKRLEQGIFRFPTAGDTETRSLEISAQELSLVLWGIDPTSVKRQKRYQRAG